MYSISILVLLLGTLACHAVQGTFVPGILQSPSQIGTDQPDTSYASGSVKPHEPRSVDAAYTPVNVLTPIVNSAAFVLPTVVLPAFQPTTSELPAVQLPSTSLPLVYVPTPSSAARRRIQSIAFDPSHQAKCPAPFTACSIQSAGPATAAAAGSWECLDLQEELSSCGRCGHDCLAIDHVGNVGCQLGICKIFSCAAGYKLTQTMDLTSGRMVDACV